MRGIWTNTFCNLCSWFEGQLLTESLERWQKLIWLWPKLPPIRQIAVYTSAILFKKRKNQYILSSDTENRGNEWMGAGWNRTILTSYGWSHHNDVWMIFKFICLPFRFYIFHFYISSFYFCGIQCDGASCNTDEGFLWKETKIDPWCQTKTMSHW